MSGTRASLAVRFWRHVEKSDGCWNWTGGTRNGQCGSYGSIALGAKDEGNDYAHRVAWRLQIGPIPDGLCVCHRCDNPSCVRPDHLFLGEQLDNMRDRFGKGKTSNGRSRGWRQRALSKEQVVGVKRVYADGMNCATIARRFNVTRVCISLIVRGLRRAAA